MEDQKNPEWHPRVVEFMHWATLVSKVPREKIPEVWCSLNHGEWPQILEGKPDGWDDMSFEEQYPVLDDLFHCLETTASKKEILRYVNTVREPWMTNAQYDDLWDSRVREDLEKILKILEENKKSEPRPDQVDNSSKVQRDRIDQSGKNGGNNREPDIKTAFFLGIVVSLIFFLPFLFCLFFLK